MVHLFCGVDSHKDTPAVCLVDQTARPHAQASFANTPAGHHQLASWLVGHGRVSRVGVEGDANLGAGLARFLADQGVDVRKVPCALTVRERRPGKSDPTDALAVALMCARNHDLPPARQPGPAEDLKVLSDYRDERVGARNAEGHGCMPTWPSSAPATPRSAGG